MQRLSDGDTTQLTLLYRHHAQRSRAAAYRILGDWIETQDLVQDVFLTVVKRSHQFQPDRGSFAVWLRMMVRSLARDRLRWLNRNGLAVYGRHHELIEAEVATEGEQESVRAPDCMSAPMMRAAFANLSERQRLVLEASFFRGLSHSEIAAREDLPLGTVKSLAKRALAAMRMALDDRTPLDR